MKRLAVFIFMIFSFASAEAKLNLSRLHSDGMVLQQNTEAKIWGTSSPHAQITVVPSWDGKAYKCQADSEGNWNVYIATPSGSYETYTLTVKGDKETVKVCNVLVGEVWMASGQSNMEMPMRGFFNCPVENAADFITAAPARERIRMITVPIRQSYEPLDDFEGSWQGADPNTVPDMSATAYFFARKLNEVLDVPVGVVAFAYGGARVESWTPKDILETYPDENLSREAIEAMQHYHRPYLAYNAMFWPVKGYTAKGFIWYQGCSNVGKHLQFPERMATLINHWRSWWNDDKAEMPFYMAEIAPFRYGSNDGVSYASLLREAQHETAKTVPNCGIVVTNDLVYSYEIDNIHPAMKQPVGERMAYLALNRDYGFKRVACESPRALKCITIQDGSAIGVELSNCWSGLNRVMEIEGLEVAGNDGIFHPVTAVGFDWENHCMSIRSEEVPAPTQVRYGWGDFNPGNLKNAEGLPVAPFWVKL